MKKSPESDDLTGNFYQSFKELTSVLAKFFQNV